MHAGKLTAAIAASALLLIAHPTFADKKADDATDDKAESAKSEKAQAEKAAKAKEPKASAKPAKAKVAKAKPAEAPPIEIAPAAADDDELDFSTLDTGDDVPWYEQPVINKKKAAPAIEIKAKGKVKKQGPKYGGTVSLGSRRSGSGPTVSEGPTLGKRLDRNAVIKVLRANEAEIGYCRVKARRSGEKATQMVLSFDIDGKGKASKVQVSTLSGAKVKRFSRCMTKRMKNWSFPAETLGGSIEYPLLVQEIGPGSKK